MLTFMEFNEQKKNELNKSQWTTKTLINELNQKIQYKYFVVFFFSFQNRNKKKYNCSKIKNCNKSKQNAENDT